MTPIPAIPDDLRAVLGRRLGAQHLDRSAPDVATVVRDSLAVQAQDPPLSRWSLGVRAGVDEPAVRAAIDSGQVLRTHVLRPTWHYVHREDIRWLLELTGPRIITGNRARQRQLGIDEELWAQTQQELRRALADGPLTRRQVQPLLPVPASSPQPNQTVAHQLMMAEAAALVCSGPLAGDEHTYVLLDDVVPPSPPLPRQEAATRLVHRFVAGHGPTSLRDLQRWSNITRTEARAGLASGGFETGTVDGVELWWQPDAPMPGLDGVHLLPTFDEAWLCHDHPRFPRLPGHRLGELHLSAAEAGWGLVIRDGLDIGSFRRRVVTRAGSRRVTVEFTLAEGVAVDPALEAAQDRMLAFFGAAAH
ncbi:winged helix DNA-binding domain-containing protein [Luteococcus sp.]|uniref:winged helix DNA-binding domain-containing protein n=1 Tax=Luteococcus sp. TaxID=1969402 RepID=UPI0037361B37